jgi:serine/threonine protein kinase
MQRALDLIYGEAMLFKLGKYEIKHELGRGAAGIVYMGFDTFIERPAAIKTIKKSLVDKSSSGEVFDRFRREAQAAGRLSHPNIVSIYEYGEEGETAYIVMEFVPGQALSGLIGKSNRFVISEIAAIMQQLLDALEYSHNCGVVHRDIKPSNILIAQNNQVKIADFGIAKLDTSEMTQVGTVLGTPSYMSPEQVLGQAADRRSDIYSVGVILYQLLTGVTPFKGGSITAVMHKVLHQAPVPLREYNHDISAVLEEIVLKAMAKRPEERFQSASEFKSALKFAMDIHELAAKAQDPDATLVGYETENILAASPPPPATAASFLRDGTSGIQNTFGGSTLLAELEQEASRNLTARMATINDAGAKGQAVHDALKLVTDFFAQFIKHVNDVEPQVERSYKLGGAAYSHLKLINAAMARYYRMEEPSVSGLLSNVVIGYSLHAPQPVVVKWRRDQMESLREELRKFKLRALDSLDAINQMPGQEPVAVLLAPDFPVQLRFQGNYDQYCIDVTALNFEAFGTVRFRLEATSITPELMDQIGLYILGRSNVIPALFQRTQ